MRLLVLGLLVGGLAVPIPATLRAQDALPPLLPGSAGQNSACAPTPTPLPLSLADSSKAGPQGGPGPWAGKGQVKGRQGWFGSDAVKFTVPSQPLVSPSGQTEH